MKPMKPPKITRGDLKRELRIAMEQKAEALDALLSAYERPGSVAREEKAYTAACSTAAQIQVTYDRKRGIP